MASTSKRFLTGTAVGALAAILIGFVYSSRSEAVGGRVLSESSVRVVCDEITGTLLYLFNEGSVGGIGVVPQGCSRK
jgi:hypothetical protein